MKSIFYKHKKISNDQGSALIGFVIMASVASDYYITHTIGLSRGVAKQKSKSEYDYYTTTLTHGVFNYTVNAIKERWCMDSNWARDIDCKGPEMKDVILNKMNLERFLWSKVAASDIEQRYKTKYAQTIPEPSTLLNLKHTIDIAELETLGLSHPLNLIGSVAKNTQHL